MPVTKAFALWDDRLELFVAETVARDDNVFRISSESDPSVVLGLPSKGDVYRNASFGFNLDVPVSRQRFLGGVTWNDSRYDRFTVLNFDGHQGRAAWLWRVGNELSGQLEYKQTRALASLANVQSGVQSSTPDPLETRSVLFSAAYMLTPRWRSRGEVSRLKQSNEVPERQVNDIRADGVDLTVSYITPANNEVGLSVKVEDSDFPTLQPVAGGLVDNAYRQRRAAALADLTITGRSHVNARAGWVGRSYEQLPQRDFKGAIFQAVYDWKATGKLTLTAVAQRDISTVEQIQTSFVIVEGVALRPTLRLTEKANLSGALEYGDRKYLGDPGLVLGIVPPRTDRVRSVAVTASYRPMRSVTLELAVRRETRSSTAAFGDYVTNGVSASVRLAF